MATGQLLAAADTGPLDEQGQARVERMRAQIPFGLNCGREAPSLLLQAAARLQPLAPARRGYLAGSSGNRHLRGRLAVGDSLSEVARAAISAPLGPEPLPYPQLLLRGLAVRVLDGYAAAAPLLKEALRLYRAQPVQPLDALCHPYCLVVAELWDDDAWFQISDGQVQLARSSGTLSWLPVALGSGFRSFTSGLASSPRPRPSISEDGRPWTRGWGSSILQYDAVLLAAWRGDTAHVNRPI